MQISAVTQKFNYSTINNSKQQTPQPSFQGALNQIELDIVLQRLAKVNDEVIEKFDIKKFEEVMDYLTKRYECLGVKSIGLQIVGNDDLPKLLGKNIVNYNTKDKIGLCVAVGDKYGPIEEMTNIYQAKTFLLKPEELKNL